MLIIFVPLEITPGVQGLPCQHMASQGKPCTPASLFITPFKLDFVLYCKHSKRLTNNRKTFRMAKVLMYSTAICPYCVMAERLLRARGVAEIEKVRVDLEPAKRLEMMEKTHRRTVPQIFIGSVYVGGFDDLSALDRAGKLAELLAGDA